jgi:tetratricopeptide (TPR) repeat protein
MNMTSEITKKIENSIKNKDFKKALSLCKKNSESLQKKDYFYLISVCYRYLNEPNKALINLDKLIQIDPNYGRAYQEIGHTNILLNDKNKAFKAYLRAVRHNPSLQSSWLGILALENKNEELINFVEQNVIYLKDLPPELKTVISFTHEGKLSRADRVCREYLRDHPHDIEAMRLLANIGRDLNIYEDAEFLLESALLFDPDNAKIKYDYINILTKRQKYGEALKHAQKFYNEDKNNINAMKLLSTALFRTDRYKEAIDIYNEILKLEPKNTDVMLSMGHLYKTSGEIDKSINSYKKAYKTDKYFGDSYWSLANLKTYTFSASEVASLDKMVSDPYVSEDERAFMHFALGKAYEDLNEYEKSFHHYKEGNLIKKNKALFNINDFEKECSNQIDVCTDDLFKMKSEWGSKSKAPIFILGLPRVGSTLIEQILSSHSLVEPTHELPNIISTALRLNERKSQDIKSRYPDILLSLSSPQLKLIGDKYIKDSEVFRSDKPYFIDKMPNNFRHIGLIKLILPNAKIIDIRRSSMSACFSCYKQLFAEGQEFTYDLKDLAGYYNNYVELMDHWNKVLPEQILSINYEDVVNNFEESVRNILDYCDIPFEQQCLEFYKSKRSVKTPSAEQVRQPIYKSGMDYWKNYEPYLDDLKNNLQY